MPIIESVQVAAVTVPLDQVTSFSTRTVSARHYCLVKVRSKDGLEGIGFCYVGSAAGDIAKLAVEQLLAPKLLGQESHRSEGLWLEMYNESVLQGRTGSVMRGISILDNFHNYIYYDYEMIKDNANKAIVSFEKRTLDIILKKIVNEHFQWI